MAFPPRLVLYDGVCGFCNRAVQDLLKLDRAGALRFAPLQGPTAADVLRRHPEIPKDLDSIIYLDSSGGEERAYWWSEAAFRIADAVEARSALLVLLRRLPRPLADGAYRTFARVRYRFFGKLDACPIPAPEVRARFLP